MISKQSCNIKKLDSCCEESETKRRSKLSLDPLHWKDDVQFRSPSSPAGIQLKTDSKGKRPAEVFRTDFITAMKVADNQALAAGKTYELNDTWRQEWEKGVQVPVNPEALPKTSFRKKEIKLQGKRYDAFSLPKARISIDNPELAHSSEKTASCLYDLDEVDVQWLQMVKGASKRGGNMDETMMEKAITYFERKCFENMAHAVATKKGLSIEYDETTTCEVCLSPDTEESNEIVFCDACNMCVHQACYGIPEIPTGTWLCRPCSRGVLSPPCVICPNKGGAMKRVKNSFEWIHVICAWWVPEVKIEDTENVEKMTVDKIPASRRNLCCFLCRERLGACIQCSVKRCVVAYHVTCAVKEGLEMKTVMLHDKDDVQHISYCKRHCVPHPHEKIKQRNGDNVENQRLKELHKLQDKFFTLIDVRSSARELRLGREITAKMFGYWVLKRKANENRPLIPLTTEQQEKLSGKQGIYLIQEQINVEMERYGLLRQDLERLRNLCYLIIRRERCKREVHKASQDVFFKQDEILNSEGASLSEEEFKKVSCGDKFMRFTKFPNYAMDGPPYADHLEDPDEQDEGHCFVEDTVLSNEELNTPCADNSEKVLLADIEESIRDRNITIATEMLTPTNDNPKTDTQDSKKTKDATPEDTIQALETANLREPRETEEETLEIDVTGTSPDPVRLQNASSESSSTKGPSEQLDDLSFVSCQPTNINPSDLKLNSCDSKLVERSNQKFLKSSQSRSIAYDAQANLSEEAGKKDSVIADAVYCKSEKKTKRTKNLRSEFRRVLRSSPRLQRETTETTDGNLLENFTEEPNIGSEEQNNKRYSITEQNKEDTGKVNIIVNGQETNRIPDFDLPNCKGFPMTSLESNEGTESENALSSKCIKRDIDKKMEGLEKERPVICQHVKDTSTVSCNPTEERVEVGNTNSSDKLIKLNSTHHPAEYLNPEKSKFENCNNTNDVNCILLSDNLQRISSPCQNSENEGFSVGMAEQVDSKTKEGDIHTTQGKPNISEDMILNGQVVIEERRWDLLDHEKKSVDGPVCNGQILNKNDILEERMRSNDLNVVDNSLRNGHCRKRQGDHEDSSAELKRNCLPKNDKLLQHSFKGKFENQDSRSCLRPERKDISTGNEFLKERNIFDAFNFGEPSKNPIVLLNELPNINDIKKDRPCSFNGLEESPRKSRKCSDLPSPAFPRTVIDDLVACPQRLTRGRTHLMMMGNDKDAVKRPKKRRKSMYATQRERDVVLTLAGSKSLVNDLEIWPQRLTRRRLRSLGFDRTDVPDIEMTNELNNENKSSSRCFSNDEAASDFEKGKLLTEWSKRSHVDEITGSPTRLTRARVRSLGLEQNVDDIST